MSKRGTLSVRSSLRRNLEDAQLLLDGWAVRTVSRIASASVLLELAPVEGEGILVEWHETTDKSIQAFVRGPRFVTAYRARPGSWDPDALDTPDEVRRMTALVCQHLAELTEGFDLRELEPGGEIREEVFSKQTFEEWLNPVLALGDTVAGQWLLDDISAFGPEEIALTFIQGEEDPDDRGATRIKIRVRDDDRPAAVRVGQLDILYRVPFGESASATQEVDDTHALAVELGHYLDAGDSSLRWLSPPRPSTGGELVEGDSPPKAINLALPGPCYQRCVFCAVREEIDPVLSANEAYIDRLRTDITESARHGTRVLRVNGLEPLRAPFAYDLFALARDEGFDEFHILSTFLPCADVIEARRLFDALPRRYSFYVPLYGSNAEVHDAVTGLAGSFDDLMMAMSHLRQLMSEERDAMGDQAREGTMIVTTVIVKQNVEDLVGMRDLVRPWVDWWEVHMAFPNTSSRRDRYRDVALPMQTVLEAVYPTGWHPLAELELGEILPCMAYYHQVATGHALLTPRRIRERKLEPSGTYYETIGFTHSMGDGQSIAFTSATIPCPHQNTCDLFRICPGKVYRAYDELFGCDELRPVTMTQIRALAEGDELAKQIQAEHQGLPTKLER